MTHTPTVIGEDIAAADAAIMQAAIDMDADTPAPNDLHWLAKHFAAHRELGERRGRIGDSDLKDFGR